jgi:lysophospholipase L1-like esterase
MRTLALLFLASLCALAQGQETNGVILLHSRAAIVHGKNLRYEPATNKNTLGFWTLPTDWAEWKFTVDRPVVYELELWQGCGKGNGGSDVRVEVAGQIFDFVVQDTGHFQNFVPRKLGHIHFWKAGEFSLAMKPQNKKAGAVMDVRQVRLLKVPFETEDSFLLSMIGSTPRVVFLGDSITYGGEYIEFLEASLRSKYPNLELDFINLGLPSETLSGLSEEGHAGGAFPRPDLHERLDRIIEKVKPDFIFACYGMNDGIYMPFNDERFQRFRQGTLRLHQKAEAAGIRIIQLTPPVFDSRALQGGKIPAGMYSRYNDVLDVYSAWLKAEIGKNVIVIDIHDPINLYLAAKRVILASDGVHIGSEGHNFVARELLFQLESVRPSFRLVDDKGAIKTDLLKFDSEEEREILKLVQQRQRLRKDAWLTHVGHKRPGMNKGKPLEEAEAEADALAVKIISLQDPKTTEAPKP